MRGKGAVLATMAIVLSAPFFAPLTATAMFNLTFPHTWIVDDDKPADFATIQAAINAAVAGDTVSVKEGVYYENVIMNKSITLLGENPETTIIDGSWLGNVLVLTADGSVVKGFQIRNSYSVESGTSSGIRILRAQYCNVTGNKIMNSFYGVNIDCGSLNTYRPCFNNSIIRNNITNCDVAISVRADRYYYEISYNNTFSENIITDCSSGIRFDVTTGNSIINNSVVGGIDLAGCWGNIISGNRIDGGISLYSVGRRTNLGYDSTNNTISKNYITNSEKAIWLQVSADNNNIIDNNITANFDGIWLTGSKNNSISGNSIMTNTHFGITFDFYPYSSQWSHAPGNITSENNIVYNNSIVSNLVGIWFNYTFSNKVFHNNFIQNNVQIQINPLSLNNIWDNGYPSGGNYWSDYNGIDTNHDGIGDSPYVVDANNQDRYPLMSPWNQPSTAFLIVRGQNSQIYSRSYNLTSNVWTSWYGLPGSSPNSPAAVVIANELHLVVRGMNEGQVWHGYVNQITDEFSGWTLLDGSTPSAPTLTANATHVCLVVRGSNNGIYYRFYNVSSRTWGGWASFPDGTASDTAGAMLVGSVLHVVVRGANFGQIWHCSFDTAAGSFSGWSLLTGSTPSPPVLASNSTHVCLVVRGDNNAIYYRWLILASQMWSDWIGFPHGLTPDVPAATILGNTLQIVVRGMNDDQIWHGTMNLLSSEWSGWRLLDGTTPSKPVLTS